MGIESLLRVRFGEEGLKLMPEIHEIHEEEKLRGDPQSPRNRGQPRRGLHSSTRRQLHEFGEMRGRLPCMLDPDDFTLAGPREIAHVRRLR